MVNIYIDPGIQTRFTQALTDQELFLLSLGVMLLPNFPFVELCLKIYTALADIRLLRG